MIKAKILTYTEHLPNTDMDAQPDQQMSKQIENELERCLQALDEADNEIHHLTHTIVQLPKALVHYYTLVYSEPDKPARVKQLEWGQQQGLSLSRWGLDGELQ